MPPFRKMLLLIVTLFFASLATHALWWVVRDELSTTWSRADWSSAKLLPRPDRHHAPSRLAKAAPAKDDWTAWSAAPMGGPMMHGSAPAPSALRPALAGAGATLSGIGLARFAYVPLFPAIVAVGWVSGAEGGFLGPSISPAI